MSELLIKEERSKNNSIAFNVELEKHEHEDLEVKKRLENSSAPHITIEQI